MVAAVAQVIYLKLLLPEIKQVGNLETLGNTWLITAYWSLAIIHGHT
jgi:hypothetical protein